MVIRDLNENRLVIRDRVPPLPPCKMDLTRFRTCCVFITWIDFLFQEKEWANLFSLILTNPCPSTFTIQYNTIQYNTIQYNNTVIFI